MRAILSNNANGDILPQPQGIPHLGIVRTLLRTLVPGVFLSVCALPAVAAEAPKGYGTFYAGNGEVRGAVAPSPRASTVSIAPASSLSPLAGAAFPTAFAAAPRRGPVIGPYDVVNKEVHFAGPDLSGGPVYGGRADTGGVGNARDNTLYFHSNEVGFAYGGQAAEEATGNVLIMYGGTIKNTLAGGDGIKGANSNRVELYGGTVVDSAYGGHSSGGDALNNSVLLEGASVSGGITGGKGKGNASGNVVELKLGSAISVTGGESSDANANNNTVRLSGAADVESIYGGVGALGAKGNRVYVSAGKVTGSTLGPDTTGVVGGESSAGIAQNNSVFVSGGTVMGDIIGGRTITGQAIHNTVTLSGRPDISAAGLFGGHTTGAATDVFTGNTLDVKGFQGRAKTVGNFENYKFFLPGGSTNGTVVLDLTGAAELAPTGKTANARITGLTQGAVKLQSGDIVHLIKSPTLTGDVNLAGGQFNQGIALSYDYALKQNGASLYAEILGKGASSTVNTPSAGPLAVTAFVNSGVDVAVGAGLDNALAAAQRQKRKGWAVFGVFTGGTTTYSSADNLRINSTHYMAGVSNMWDTGSAEIVAGIYFDAGIGNYDNELYGARAEGDTNYYGGGLLARYGVTRGALSGVYVEATARAGISSSEYQSPDLAIATMGEVESTSDTPYYSAHLGLGWIFPVAENMNLDIYGKFLWSRLDSSKQTLAHDPYRFDPTDSYRTRGGLRLTHRFSDSFSLFYGAAYEHEFDGQVRGKVYSYNVKGADIRGGTGIGEVGLAFILGDEGRVALDVSAQGFMGKREGVMGQMRMQYAF